MGVTQGAPGRPIGELPLAGGGGEPVDLARTLASHGVATLPPQRSMIWESGVQHLHPRLPDHGNAPRSRGV